MRMGRRIASTLKRTAIHALPTVLGIIVLDFLFLQLMPGDAADVMATEAGSATAETVAALRHQFGIDQPVLTQLANFLSHLARLDLGYSPRFNASVGNLIMARLPNTLLLMVSALTLALVLGIVVGSVMAAWQGKWPDRALSVVVLLFYSMPGFWVGLMAVVLFSVKLGWLPSDGNETIGANLSGFALVSDRLTHLILPALALASFFIAVYARLTRAAMLEVQRQDFMRTARAKGLHPLLIQLRHALRNALVPVTTVAGMNLGNLLGGAVVVETLFGWPGMGRLTLDAVLGRDYSVLLGVLLLSSFVVIVVNVLIDLLHAWLDPRIGATE
ncbi:peptide/nickel transport system permease protein [Enhydrobacter aerosaccus]|uniref:Peptide/nickel transport system permease protein n=1 Tax=Enhydrobacter aerosaccus TaxID=225324 RepID=A0A1T4QDE7_9HYPH|nr:ABC transporter permease [Enhydrobacter aerosaccus]SKA01769.1 peptide/nickel transport system permease protein [Enhydrobacter aerosaccus]